MIDEVREVGLVGVGVESVPSDPVHVISLQEPVNMGAENKRVSLQLKRKKNVFLSTRSTTSLKHPTAALQPLDGEVIPEVCQKSVGLFVYFIVHHVNECGGSLKESVLMNKRLKNKKVSMVFVFLCISPTLVFWRLMLFIILL